MVNPPSISARGSGSDTHGIVYSSVKERKETLNYPFELSGVISSSRTRTLSDFVDQVVQGDSETYRGVDQEGEVSFYSSPYQATSAGFSYCTSYVSSLMSKEDMSHGDSTFLGFFTDLIQRLSYVASFASLSTDFAVQLQALCEAAENKMTFEHLMVYLAFRQEKLSGYNGGEDPEFGPSTVLRNSSTLKNVLKNRVTSGKVSNSYVSKPKDVSVTPSPTGDGQTSFTAPEKTTTTTIEQNPSQGQTGTLESMFDTSYEEVCESFAHVLAKRFNYNSTSGFSVDTSKTKTFQKGSLEDLLKRTTGSSLPVFDMLLDYSDIMQKSLPEAEDGEDISIFISGDGSRTKFNTLRKDNCFVAFSLAACKVSKLMLKDKMTITYPSRSSSKTHAKVSSSKAFARTTKTTTSPYSVKFSTDWQSSIDDLRAFVDSTEKDTTDIIDSFPVLAAIAAALAEEENFLSSFSGSLSSFFTAISNNFDKVSLTLAATTDGVSLADRMKSGFRPSSDMLKLLKSYEYSWNAKDMVYNGVKTKDKTLSKHGWRTLRKILWNGNIIPIKKQKILCVGLPAGLLQDVKNMPSEIDEVSGFADSSAVEDKFTVVVQKIDQADPDVKYKDKEFKFSRSLFCIGSNPTLRFVKIDEDLDCTEIRYSDAKRTYGKEVADNHTADFILKQYADLQLDVDFNESAFCNDKKYINKVKNKTIELPALSSLDTTTEQFLTASNLAFDPLKRKLDNMQFYDPKSLTLSLDKKSSSDVYDYSSYNFVSSYGSLFIPKHEDERLSEGVMFEKTICIPIDDDSFELDTTDEEEDSREVNAQIRGRLASQRMVGIGKETSEGVDLFTYRISIKMGEES